MYPKLNDIYTNAERAGMCNAGLQWLTSFKTLEEAEQSYSAPNYFYWYVKHVAKKPCKWAEKAISRSPKYSFYYARDIKKGRFSLGEKAIATDATYATTYALDICKVRFKMAESTIIKDRDEWVAYSDFIKRANRKPMLRRIYTALRHAFAK